MLGLESLLPPAVWELIKSVLFSEWQVTVMHSMYAGYMDKAIRYSEKALVQVDRLKSTCNVIYLHSFI